MMITMTFSQIATFASHDRRCKVRICPRMKPQSMKTTSATMTIKRISFRFRFPDISSSLTAQEPIAAWTLGHLSKTLATALDDQDHIEKELETLKEVYSHACPVAIDSKSNIAVI